MPRELDTHYDLANCLGKGGFGAVYRARPKDRPHLEVALKVLERPHVDADSFEARFLREVKNARRLDHPHAVRLFEFGALFDGRLFYEMEICDGPSLRDVLTRDGPLRPDRLVRIAAQVLSALGAAHAMHMVHRDIKPDNVHLVAGPDGYEAAKVLDFGLAKMGGGRASQELTQVGQVLGTLEYMAPEQLMGKPLDGRADIYATAVMLFELLSGRRPFEADDDLALTQLQLTAPPPSLTELTRGRVSPALDAVIYAALAKAPERRPPSAEAFAEALLRAEPAARSCSGEPVRTEATKGSPSAGSSAPPTRVAGAAPPATRVGAAASEPASTRAVAPPKPAGAVPDTTPLPGPVVEAVPTRPLGAGAAFDRMVATDTLPLGGRYMLRRMVSDESRHGTTYEGFDLQDKVSVCIKVLKGRGAVSEDEFRRYMHGVDALSRIRHHHVVALLDGGTTPDGKPYVVTEWVPGFPVRRFLAQYGTFPLAQAAGVVCQLLEGLAAVHQAGVIHRNITPGHLLLVPTQRGAVVKLFGFGIAKAIVGANHTETRWGIPVGSPGYMAPEQLLGRPLDPRSDLFACGVTLWEMLVGRQPVTGENAVEVAQAVFSTPPTPLPESLDAGVRARVDPILARALARGPGHRFGTALALREALTPLAGPLALGDFEGAAL
ncbi:MAG: protein kinase domain-containing protein [Planctomycetota bacterium]